MYENEGHNTVTVMTRLWPSPR